MKRQSTLSKIKRAKNTFIFNIDKAIANSKYPQILADYKAYLLNSDGINWLEREHKGYNSDIFRDSMLYIYYHQEVMKLS